jgi:hypothetical protein
MTDKLFDDDDELFGEPISVYTRQQAIEDGTLVDVSSVAKEAGFRYPVAVTRAVWAAIEDIPKDSGQDVQGRLWDILFMLNMEIHRRTAGKGPVIFYKIIMDRTTTHEKTLELKAVIGPGDDPSPVITIMLPEED